MKPRRQKAKHKPAKLDARVSNRMAYGAELAARKALISRSSWIAQAIQRALILDGFCSDTVNRLWADSPEERLELLAKEMPELLTDDERSVFSPSITSID